MIKLFILKSNDYKKIEYFLRNDLRNFILH